MILKFGNITIVKNEKELLDFLLKFWGGFIIIIATGYFANQTKLYQVEQFLGVFNIVYFFIISIYGFAASFISLKNNKPTNCTLTIFCGSLIALFLGISDIIWYNVDQVTITWLDLIFTVLEFCICNYIGLTIFILNNLKIINLKKNEELKKSREAKKVAYEKERRNREKDRRIRENDRRKILDGLANVAVDRRVGNRDRRSGIKDRRSEIQTENEFKNNVAKRTAEMVGFLTDTLDKLDDEINELDDEIRVSDEKISCLEESPICIDISEDIDSNIETAVIINDSVDIISTDDENDDENNDNDNLKKSNKK